MSDNGQGQGSNVELTAQVRALSAENQGLRDDLGARQLRAASQGRLAAIIESSNDAIVSKTLDGIIITWNAAAERLFGYSADEAVGRPITMLFPPDRLGEEREFLDHIRRGERVSHYETIRVRKDGRPVEIAVSLSPVRDGAGRIIGAAKIARDLSERRAADRRVRAVEQQFRTFVNSVTEYAIFRITPDGKIASWNPGARLMKGYEEHEAIGMDFARLFLPEDQAAGKPARELALAAEHGEHKDEGKRLRKNGEVFVAHIVLTAIRDEHGRLEGFMKVTRDVTERKRYEAELKAAKEAAEQAREAAEQANRSKDHFLAVLSHELRTPLTPVLAAAEQLRENPLLHADLREDVAMIRRNAELEARIIDDLLHLTRISRGKVELHFEVTDTHAALRNCLDMFGADIAAKRIEVSLDPGATCRHVWADPARLQQVFCNLVSNAVKFTPAGGRVTLRTANDGPDAIAVEVADTGVGIAPAFLPNVFDAFEQGERTVTRRFGGLGLGLAIAKAIVDLHGGRIEAFSDGPDRGARFVVRMRAVSVPPPPGSVAAGTPPHEPAAAACAGKLRILLVEDHPDTLRMMARLLAGFGYDVQTAETMRDGADRIDREPFDLLVSDIGLPDGSGLELMRQAKAKRRLRGIALSGFGMDDDIRRSREAGFDHHLIKPVNFAQLQDVIRRVGAVPKP